MVYKWHATDPGFLVRSNKGGHPNVKAARKFPLFLLLASFCWLASTQRLTARTAAKRCSERQSAVVLSAMNSGGSLASNEAAVPADSGGLREVIEGRYKSRYQVWKNEFLSTDIGRAQWEMYAHHPRLVLTITVADSNPNGAATG